jgi:hypothetical protein
MSRLRAAYGAAPLHALAVIASFAVAGYALLRLSEGPTALGTFVWFGAAIFAHDLVAFPLYSALNLIAHHSLGEHDAERRSNRRVPVINHLRVPTMLSAISFLLFFPLILGLSSTNYVEDTGVDGDVFFGRWLGLCAVLFLGSAVIYALRLRRSYRGDPETAG